ncbi:MAG: hypothetical protein UT37_C0001G0019 [Parcubacteria group bacterium GW2011_GWA2_39_18]|nr:MAG: hypothetical protein UT37_C0001G0019 [Parcubacteria group bacterium GW2011_GWA2_39_18]
MRKIFSYVFLTIVALSAFAFWHLFQRLAMSFDWLGFALAITAFIFLAGFEMLLLGIGDSKLFSWLSFVALVLSFLSEFGIRPIYLLAVILSLLAFWVSKKTIQIDASKILRFSFWQIVSAGAKVYVIAVAILFSVALFSFSPQMILRGAGLNETGLTYSFKLAQNILKDKVPYFSSDLTGEQFAVLYMFDQAKSQISVKEAEQALPLSVRGQLRSRNINLLDFVEKPNIASQNKDILNSIVDFAKKQPGFIAQEKAFLDQIGLSYADAAKPITGAVSDLILSKASQIWPQYGFIISLALALILFLFLQSVRYWLSLPGIFIGMFVVWLMRKFKVINVEIKKVDKEELLWG